MRNPSEKELNEIEVSNLSDIELNIMIIRILKELSENYKELYGSYKGLSGNYHTMKKDIETRVSTRK